MSTQHVPEVVVAAPPVSVSALTLLGVPLADWVVILTGIYTIASIFFLFRDKWWRQRKQ